MREIKFRGITTNFVENKFVYGFYVQSIEYDLNKEKQISHSIIDIEEKSYFINVNTLGQFTGLTDKNGVEIYEGDIVKIIDAPVKDDTFTVEWSDGKEFCIGFGLFSCFDYKVIGNIHEMEH